MFSSTVEYALRALSLMALTPDERLSAGALSERTKAPPDYLSKVLQQLAAAGLVSGRRGVGGGYTLARPPSDIRLLDAVQAVGGIQRIESCPLGLQSHGGALCPLHRRMDRIAALAIAELDGVTLSDLIDEPGANTPLCEHDPRVTLRVDAKK